MILSNLRINIDRLISRIEGLAEIGAIAGGGVCRMALTDEDRQGRDLVVKWMHELDLEVTVDQIGNVVGIRPGQESVRPVMTGSHIDTVASGGRYDGNLGVLAGLEVIATLNDAKIITRKPIGVGFFTNEEGSRFAPDMMGSGVHQGAFELKSMLDVLDIDGERVGDELEKIGYAGDISTGDFRADSFFELHVEQGPILELEDYEIGAVEGVQGISWNEYRISGTANHAGTTPMRLRHDAGYVAAAISIEVRRLAKEMGGNQIGTVGVTKLNPGLINVIAKEALITIDMRNTDEQKLQEAERSIGSFIEQICKAEGVTYSSRTLARFEPVSFDKQMVSLVSETASALGFRVKSMPSGAGHDAQMFAPNCPTAMIFVPSQNGISHNVAEYTEPKHLQAGADVLLQILLHKSV
ncbi:MAG: Zn-dependent hydrolase [SAR324 cluster bacterium]|nr:Zn-dependent hydrolase [SAR324 cluster bacterium]MEC9070613.1 Zn-dependent hydrolase [SAR324 cluster bacterium]MED5241219.1 Zn-dependent hydrolase [SAR324 cluster bacterium]MED5516712.1 Zn-dependent hydrolase [SAR324 cluster bacterium]MED6340122.1 Zn-dependent hydrolase [SAR324 cluster bacterium]